jgi:predicted metal-dependent hydrolase
MKFKEQPLKQDWTQELPKYYFDNSPLKTHFLNALSITFPHGERFFIDSIKNYKDRIDDVEQQEAISTFVKQENWHRYAHQQYNLWLTNQGLPAEYLEDLALKKIEYIKTKISPRGRLASTVSLEHITAIFAEHLLTHPELLDSMHPHFRQLWTWHAIEEIEHKNVAIDTINAVGGGKLRLSMILTTVNFAWDISRNLIVLLKADKQLWKLQTLKDAVSLLFNLKNGFVTKLFVPWLGFMRKGFHPSQHDNTDLLLQYSKV